MCIRDRIKGEEWQKAKEAQRAAVDSDKLIKSKGMEFSVAFNVTIMFKYSPTENAYRFTSAMLFLQFGFQFKQTIRLTVCPIVYAYFVVGASLELAGGVVNEREVVEDTSGMLDVNTVPATVNSDASAYNNGKLAYIATNLSTGLTSGWKTADDEVASGKKVLAGSKGDAFTFISKSDAVNLYFSGKVKVELKDGRDVYKRQAILNAHIQKERRAALWEGKRRSIRPSSISLPESRKNCATCGNTR